MTKENKKLRPIAFYLPQFHPIPENDLWWGKGFTEWTNVVQAKPRFKGHYQPHIPADLGFYDLRLPETRQAQADLAKEYGIHGFCYYHYWFHGHRLLERPFNEVLESGKPYFPFCLCWANENWRNMWDDTGGKILMKQTYSQEDDLHHIRWLARAFADARYIRIENKPLFLVYRASQLPDPLKTTTLWREESHRLGIGDIFLCRVESSGNEHGNPELLGFDAAVEFQPDWINLIKPIQRKLLWFFAKKLGLVLHTFWENRVYDYAATVHKMLQKPSPPYIRFPCVTPSWDNSARRKTDAVIFHNSTPDIFEEWLRGTIEKPMPYLHEPNYIFINAWNEWAEGNHLEPCQRWGRSYLDAVKRVLDSNSF